MSKRGVCTMNFEVFTRVEVTDCNLHVFTSVTILASLLFLQPPISKTVTLNRCLIQQSSYPNRLYIVHKSDWPVYRSWQTRSSLGLYVAWSVKGDGGDSASWTAFDDN